MKPTVTGMTLSIDLSSKEYGNGDSVFQNITVKWPDEGVPLEKIEDVVDDSLEIFSNLWLAVLGQRCGVGLMSFADLRERLLKIRTRFQKVKSILREPLSND